MLVSGKLLKLEFPVAERFYTLYREQFNPELTVPDSVVEEWISVETFRAKEKITAKPQQVVDWTFCGKSPPLIIESKDLPAKAQRQKQHLTEGRSCTQCRASVVLRRRTLTIPGTERRCGGYPVHGVLGGQFHGD